MYGIDDWKSYPPPGLRDGRFRGYNPGAWRDTRMSDLSGRSRYGHLLRRVKYIKSLYRGMGGGALVGVATGAAARTYAKYAKKWKPAKASLLGSKRIMGPFKARNPSQRRYGSEARAPGAKRAKRRVSGRATQSQILARTRRFKRKNSRQGSTMPYRRPYKRRRRMRRSMSSKRFKRAVNRLISKADELTPPMVIKNWEPKGFTFNGGECAYLTCYINNKADMDTLMNSTHGPQQLLPNSAYTETKYQSIDYGFDDPTNNPTPHSKLHFIYPSTFTFEIRNNDLVDCIFEIYDLMCVDHTSVSPYTLYSQWYTKYADGGSYATEIQHKMCEAFNYMKRKWKMVKRTKVRLKPAEEYTYSRSLASRTPYDPYFANKAGQAYYKGLSRAFIIRAHGAICHDDADHTKVNYSHGSLDVICKTYKRYRIENPKYKVSKFTDNTLSTIIEANEDQAQLNVIQANPEG